MNSLTHIFSGYSESSYVKRLSIFGYTSEEVMSQPASKIFAFKLVDQQKILQRLKAGEHIEPFETQVLTKENKVLDLSLKISPVKDSDGRLIGISKIARDIIELKQNERRIIEKEASQARCAIGRTRYL